jgi:type I restriction enzyme R subunit
VSHADETEAETRRERIDPALKAAGWDEAPARVRCETIAKGRLQSGGKRGRPTVADYVLEYRGKYLAVIEAKRAGLSHREGLQQAKDDAGKLGARFAYSTNGRAWYEMDLQTGQGRDVEGPPTPNELWDRAFPPRTQSDQQTDWRARFGAIPFAEDGGKWEPRYYQYRAIDAVLERIARGEKRILLTLATGTGKTGIAVQIAWKLFEARWTRDGEGGRQPRILFLADRNTLADQAINAFSAFPDDAVKRIEPKTIKKGGGVPKNASLFFTIFQTFMTKPPKDDAEDGAGTDEPDFRFGEYPPDFFDFIVVDECHRGGTRDESSWRGILEHFAPAVQLGLTATPLRDDNRDTYRYFGEPAYVYSLKEGIEDGYLSPFKVRQIASSHDNWVWDGDGKVLSGEEPELGTVFEERNFNRTIEMPARERSRIRQWLHAVDQSEKAIVFGATQRHAALLRDLINEEAASTNPNYCVRVTADDGARGEELLRTFQDNAKTIPTVLTTSQKLSTGVDARNVRHIVLLRPVTNMVEFKQIIGRGTWTFDSKDHFTIWDFVKASELFADPEWDGEPEEKIKGAGVGKPEAKDAEDQPDEEAESEEDQNGLSEPLVVELPSSAHAIKYIGTTRYWLKGESVSAGDYIKHLFGDLGKLAPDEDALRTAWRNPDRREAFLEALADQGYARDDLETLRSLVQKPDSDLFDVLAYIRFDLDPKARAERADAVREGGLSGFNEEMRAFLEGVLTSYVREGISELRTGALAPALQNRYGGMGEARAKLGDVRAIRDAFIAMQSSLYDA